MKQLLTSAGFAAMLLLCAVFCQAQHSLPSDEAAQKPIEKLMLPDSVHDGDLYYRDSIVKLPIGDKGILPIILNGNKPVWAAIDTCKVLMLVTDTTSYLSAESSRGFGQCYWRYGYSVPINGIMSKYLDADKQPIKKGVFVWMSVAVK